MKDGASKSFEQADGFEESGNCQAAVDETAQVIVATNVTQESNDKKQVKPLIENLKQNTCGEKPAKASADAGYFSESNIAYFQDEKIDDRIQRIRLRRHRPLKTQRATAACPARPHPEERHNQRTHGAQVADGERPRHLQKTPSDCKEIAIVEPVFGQLKEGRGFRRFLLRGLENVSAEWDLICLTHNLLKLFRSGFIPQTA
jgi:IS5 family transposase